MKNAYQGHIRKAHIPQSAGERIEAVCTLVFVAIPFLAIVVALFRSI